MSASAPLSEAVLARVAELRAEGSGWLPVADELGYDPTELKQLCADAGPTFDRLLDHARNAVLRDGLAEAVFVFRQQMRGRDSTAARRAAEAMSRTAIAQERLRLSRQRLEVQAAAVEAKTSDDPKKFFPNTPVGRAALADYEYGVMMKAADAEYAKRFPEDEARRLAGLCPMCGRPELPEGDPPSDDFGGSPVPRDPTPPTTPGSTGAPREESVNGESAPVARKGERIWGLPLEYWTEEDRPEAPSPAAKRRDLSP